MSHHARSSHSSLDGSLRATLTLASSLLVAAACASGGAGAGGTTVAAATSPAVQAAGPAATWERRFLDAGRPIPAGVKYQFTVTESPIEAATMQEFLQKYSEASRRMGELRTERSPGSSQWRLSWPWQMETHLSRCQFKDLTVRVSYEVDVARLAGPVAQDSAARAAWAAQVERQFAFHADRIRTMRESARGLYQKMRVLSNSSCTEMANIANEMGRGAVIDLNRQLGSRLNDSPTRVPPE